MYEYLMNNPIWLLILASITIVVGMFIFIKAPKKSSKSKPEKKDTGDKKTEKTAEKKDGEEKSSDSKPEKKDISESEDKKKLKKVKKAKEKPKIEYVYEKKVEEPKEEKKEVVDDGEIEKRAQFVKTGNKISKFIGLKDVSEIEQPVQNDVSQEIVEVPLHEECEVCEEVVKHFDHSRRLSKMVKEDLFDEMFASHLSEKYMNFDSNKHLKTGEDVTQKLYDRALKTLSNSSVKVLLDQDSKESKPVEKIRNDRDFMRKWLEDRKKEEYDKIMNDGVCPDCGNDELVHEIQADTDLSLKNIVVVDSILNRKGKKTIKK